MSSASSKERTVCCSVLCLLFRDYPSPCHTRKFHWKSKSSTFDRFKIISLSYSSYARIESKSLFSRKSQVWICSSWARTPRYFSCYSTLSSCQSVYCLSKQARKDWSSTLETDSGTHFFGEKFCYTSTFVERELIVFAAVSSELPRILFRRAPALQTHTHTWYTLLWTSATTSPCCGCSKLRVHCKHSWPAPLFCPCPSCYFTSSGRC